MPVITKTNAAPYYYRAATEKSQNAAAAFSSEKHTAPESFFAQLELPVDWQRQAALQRAARDTLSSLMQKYSGVTVTIMEETPSSIRQEALLAGTGRHLLISREFMDRMAATPEDYAACKTALETALQSLLGNKTATSAGIYLAKDRSTKWEYSDKAEDKQQKSALEALLEVLKQNNQSSKNQRYSVKMKSYSTQGYYSRLVNAGSKGAVYSVISDANRAITELRGDMVSGDEKVRKKATRAVRSLQKLLHQSGKKIRKLDEERLVEVRRKRAEQEEKAERARKLQHELQKRRRTRRSAETILLRAGVKDYHFEKKWIYETGDAAADITGTGGVTDSAIVESGGEASIEISGGNEF